jgi:hypothetical protein
VGNAHAINVLQNYFIVRTLWLRLAARTSSEVSGAAGIERVAQRCLAMPEAGGTAHPAELLRFGRDAREPSGVCA